MEKLQIYKDYIVQLKRKAINRPYIILGEDVAPKLRQYVYMLENIEFKDGEYHSYYGRMVRIIKSFIDFRTEVIDQCIKEVDHYTNVVDKKSLVYLINRTINIQKYNDTEFVNAFDQSEATSEEIETIHELTEMYDKNMESLHLLKDKIEKFDKMDVMVEFSKEHFPISLEMMNELLCFTHEYVAVALTKFLYKIRVSLEEIHLRMYKNLKEVEKENEENLVALKRLLYEKHKEKLIVNRRLRRSSTDIAKITKEIQSICEKVENYEEHPYLDSLRKEVDYWRQKLDYFSDIEATLKKIKAEEENVDLQTNAYNNINSTVLPGPRHNCWKQIKRSLEKRKEHVKQQKINASFALFTFFGVKGQNKMVFSEEAGQCWLDTFNHKIYAFDYGLRKCHMNEDEKFVEISEDKYYFDEYGRYILKDGNKLYQLGPCTSKYKLSEDNLFVKVPTDEEKIKPFKDYEHYEILPETEEVDFKSILDKETVKYLWGSLGSILPEALRDVGAAVPNNPIHYLAHRILYHKYGKPFKEIEKRKRAAVLYREDVLQQRKNKAIAAAKAWKAKQVQRRKPEESDDTRDLIICQNLQEQQALIDSLQFYYV